ncbi:hypothetical protein AERO8C_70174 [Aeromonas veronii]|uniref:Uncharacterized protein n=1 Tax=Aeromonas veronii TaxID=654 RepID=A0A653LB05_AERVE|nr:hypothetical protein AERO8C_70174 [Aeromonas veronii]
MELQQPGQLLFHHPIITLIDIEVDRGVTLQGNQFGGDFGRQRLVENELILFVMDHGAIGSNEVDVHPQRIAEAANVNVMTAGGDHEFHTLFYQAVQGIPGTGRDLVLLVEQSAIEIGYNYLEHHYLGID